MENYLGTSLCSCGKPHDIAIDEVVVGNGVISQIPHFLKKYNSKRPFIFGDRNTFEAAGHRVCKSLEKAGYLYSKYIYNRDFLEPDEFAVGSAVMHFDPDCDLIIGLGSGVINDIGKILSSISGRKYIIVATAPSMDGYASATSSMNRDGLKISLPSRCADVIIGDVDVLKNAPLHMLKSGLGDMIAKYISIAEWRISHLVTGEYYCEQIAQMVRTALKKCVGNAEALLYRDEAAVQTVFEGLVIGGVAMAYAGVSRPASGVEHYFSHVWDMRSVEFGTRTDLHGIQCAMGTLTAAKLYNAVKQMTPDSEKAAAYVEAFSWEDWQKELKAFLGRGADAMITLEEKEQKYNKAAHPARFAIIQDNWDAILRIIDEEIPSYEFLGKLMDTIGISKDLSAIGVDQDCAKMTFRVTKDIRDKYVLSRLAWDLGILDELCDQI